MTAVELMVTKTFSHLIFMKNVNKRQFNVSKSRNEKPGSTISQRHQKSLGKHDGLITTKDFQ